MLKKRVQRSPESIQFKKLWSSLVSGLRRPIFKVLLSGVFNRPHKPLTAEITAQSSTILSKKVFEVRKVAFLDFLVALLCLPCHLDTLLNQQPLGGTPERHFHFYLSQIPSFP